MPSFPAAPFLECPGLDFSQERLHSEPETDAKIKSFLKDGYLVLPGAIAEALVAILKTRHSGKPYEQWRRIQDAWHDIPLVKSIASDEKILNLLETLYHRRPIPFQTLNFCLGSEQKTHSDCIHFSSKPERYMCGVWVALEDIDASNGPLTYYPGSHKLPMVTMEDLGIDGLATPLNYAAYRQYEDYLENMIATLNLKPVSLNVKKGDALIWSANLLHGGAPILDPSCTRFSQVTHYYFENCLYYTPLFSNTYQGKLFYRQINDIRTGEWVKNRYLGNLATDWAASTLTLWRRGKLFLRKLLKTGSDASY